MSVFIEVVLYMCQGVVRISFGVYHSLFCHLIGLGCLSNCYSLFLLTVSIFIKIRLYIFSLFISLVVDILSFAIALKINLVCYLF